MANVVSSQMATCPSCAIQAIIRVWSCGCQGVDHPDHLDGCDAPQSYFDVYPRLCQELDEHGRNPQTHLRVVAEAS